MTCLFEAGSFEPTLAAAVARLAAVRPVAYARTRNHLDGAVTRLSPYITHGFLSLPQVLADVRARQTLDLRHKFVYELGWREYFHHVWRYEGEAIFDDLHAGPLPREAYADVLPTDIREGRTGVPAIDTAVRELYATGWLHNHARMWLASYVVHLRKVHWRAGADWLYGHLLDGDLASNHLSWQWVAGTASRKPYLFNAGNVERYAGAAWHSRGTPLDASYEALDRIARSPRPVPVAGGDGVEEPTLLGQTPPNLLTLVAPDAVPEAWRAHGRAIWLVHPWSLGEPPHGVPDDALRLGLVDAAFHRRWPWSERRWRFVATRLTASCVAVLPAGEQLPPTLEGAVSVHAIADPHAALPLAAAEQVAAPRIWPDPGRRCASFSSFWNEVSGSVQRDLRAT